MVFFSTIFSTISYMFYLISNLLNPGYRPTPPAVINNANYPICVIGAGISGLNIANLLQKKGYLVHIYEKNPRVGGKILTYRQGEEIQVEMAPLLYVPSNLALLKKVNEFQLTGIPYNESDSNLFDSNSGRIFPRPSFTTEEVTLLTDAIKRYAVHYAQYENDLQYGYVDASPEILIPISTWLEMRNLQALRPFFTLLFTVEGYGALDELPAIYAMRLGSVGVIRGLGSFAGTFMTVKEGLDVLAERMASSVTVFLSREMTQISRQRDHQLLAFNDVNMGHGTQKCRSVILAFPPLLPSLEKLVVDLTDAEKRVFANVRIHYYTSAAHHIPALERSLYYQPNPLGKGEVTAFIRQSTKKLQNVYSSYSWIRGDFNVTPSVSHLLNIESQLEATLQKIDTNSKTFFRAAFEYFPHVRTPALVDGFYKQFDALQGNGGIYYATTLLTFETMNNALEMTETFVDRYF